MSGTSEVMAKLGEEFPGWSVLVVGGRWWAVRLPVISEQPDEGSCLHADSPEELRALLVMELWRHASPSGLLVLPVPPGGLSGPCGP